VLGVVAAGVLLVVEVAEDELPELPPQPAIARVLATSVSIAISGVLFMGRAPNLARGLGHSPYQPLFGRT
jgi:hypothetical protein